MGQTSGGTNNSFLGMQPGSTGLNLLKGGMTGLSQGLQNYQHPGAGFDFSKLQQGFQAARPALGRRTTPNAAVSQSPFSANPWSGTYT